MMAFTTTPAGALSVSIPALVITGPTARDFYQRAAVEAQSGLEAAGFLWNREAVFWLGKKMGSHPPRTVDDLMGA